ncbi:MAG TPA: hypothetical protein VG455_04245 [Acidimicrobiales bacterium]|nr:hypothetical protein [Acidimicrobiales bacterium]
MFARVRTFNAPTEGIDESTTAFRDSFLPRIRQLDGYRGFFLLVDRQWGRLLGVALYADQASMEAATQSATDLSREAGEQLGLAAVNVEDYEVVIDERA